MLFSHRGQAAYTTHFESPNLEIEYLEDSADQINPSHKHARYLFKLFPQFFIHLFCFRLVFPIRVKTMELRTNTRMSCNPLK